MRPFASTPGLALAFCIAGGVWASGAAAPSTGQSSIIMLETMSVTGTNLPGTAQPVGPFVALDESDLAVTGLGPHVMETLRKRLPAFSGNGNLGAGNATTGVSATMAGTQLSYHNLDTLVLVNGRRIAPNGANGRGGNSFIDVSQIPAAAIARIEILGAGASAVYGSDAVGGVVNIILKSDYRGAELGGRVAWAAGGGDYLERSSHLLAGTGARGWHVNATAAWTKTDPLFQKDRPFSASIVGQTATISGAIGEGTAFPRYFLAPSLASPRERNPVGPSATAPGMAQLVANGTYQDLGAAAFATIASTFDLAPYQTLALGQERKSGAVNAWAALSGERLVVFGDYLRTNGRNFSQLAAQFASPNLTVPAGAPYNPTTAPVTQVAFRYLPAPRQFTHDSQLDRATLGLRGAITEEWSWEVAGTWNDNAVTQRVRNVLYGPNLDRAVAGGFNAQGVAMPGGAFSRVVTGFNETGPTAIQPALDPFARPGAVDPASLANLFGTYVARMTSRLDTFDLKLRGAPWRLPAGPLRFAVGGEFRRDALTGTPDDNARLNSPTGRRWLGAPFFDPFARRREVRAGFAEIRVPLAGERRRFPGARELDVNLAYRAEHYSDAGHKGMPEVGVRWRPVDAQLTLRGRYGEAFSAPPLYSLFGPVTQTFTPAAVIQGVFGLPGQALARTGSNPDLRPATARTKSVGVSLAPKALKGFTASVDYVHATLRDIAGSVGAATILQSVEQLGAASPYASQVALGNFPGDPGAQPITAAGALSAFLRAGNSANGIFVADTRANIAGQQLETIDATLNHVVPLGASPSRLRLNATATFFLTSKFQALPTQQYYDYAGHATNGGVGAQGTLPRYRTYSFVDWNRRRWGATLGHTFIPRVTDIGAGGAAFAANPLAQRRPVASFSAWDVSLSYALEGARRGAGGTPASRYQLKAGINNVTNRMPPRAPQAFSDSNVDLATYPFLGRLCFVGIEIKL